MKESKFKKLGIALYIFMAVFLMLAISNKLEAKNHKKQDFKQLKVLPPKPNNLKNKPLTKEMTLFTNKGWLIVFQE